MPARGFSYGRRVSKRREAGAEWAGSTHLRNCLKFPKKIIDHPVNKKYIRLRAKEAETMKREEKNAQTRQRILNAAMQEFAGNDFQQASLNRICAASGLSKGIIYHYFQDKEDLCLACVRQAAEQMLSLLQENYHPRGNSIEEDLQNYFETRLQLLRAHPVETGVFKNVMMEPDPQLREKIREIRQPFDDYNLGLLKTILAGAKLDPVLKKEEAIEDFRTYIDDFSMRFQVDPGQSADEILQAHEKRCLRQIHILLYGILER
jgi:TetR/AcrR family transcriptional regulator